MTDESGRWGADWPIDDDMVRRLIASQFPGLGPVRATGRDGGTDIHAVEINSAWIFRFPKRPECTPMLRRELTLLPHVAPVVFVPVPGYEFAGPDPGLPLRVRRIPQARGTPAIDAAPGMIAIPELATCLGGLPSALHAFPSGAADRLGVVRLADYEDTASLRASTLEELESIRDSLTDAVFSRCRALVDRAGHALGGSWGPPRLLHGDLSAEHLLFDPRTGRVVRALIDGRMLAGGPGDDLESSGPGWARTSSAASWLTTRGRSMSASCTASGCMGCARRSARWCTGLR